MLKRIWPTDYLTHVIACSGGNVKVGCLHAIRSQLLNSCIGLERQFLFQSKIGSRFFIIVDTLIDTEIQGRDFRVESSFASVLRKRDFVDLKYFICLCEVFYLINHRYEATLVTISKLL